MAMEDATLIKRGNQSFVLRSLSSGDEYLLQGEMLVGRELDCAISLHSGHISRYHAKINVSPNGVYVEDLQSTNGTYVNGQKVRGRVRLNLGDEVSFDDVPFRLASHGSHGDTTMLSRRPSAETLSPAQLHARATPNPARPIRPSLVAAAPARPATSAEYPRNLQQVDELLEEQAPVASHRERSPYDADLKVAGSARRESSEPAPEPEQEGDRTQILSAVQLDRIVERGRASDQDIQVGTGPRLIVLTAPLRGKLYELQFAPTETTWQIGRATTAEICLGDKTISNDHARLIKVDDGFQLTATHAKNGILVNGEPLKGKVLLSHGDKIQIGRTELVFKSDEGEDHSTSVIDRLSVEETSGVKRFSIVITMVALIVLILAIFATSH